jgi:DNA invertase Pin-like site-specific DNA recombinase
MSKQPLLSKTNDSLNVTGDEENGKIPKKMKPQKPDVFLNTESKRNRVLIYGRVSTQDQDARNQIGQLKEYAAAQNWDIVDVVTDTCSGAKDATERVGLSKVLTLAHQKRFDVLLFWSLDRFSREGSRKTIGYLTQLEQFGVGWHSFTEPYLSTLGVFSDAIIALLSALAKQERLRIGERTKAGLERAKASGKKLGRPRTATDRIAAAKKLRTKNLSFAEIGRRLGVSRVRAFQLCNG